MTTMAEEDDMWIKYARSYGRAARLEATVQVEIFTSSGRSYGWHECSSFQEVQDVVNGHHDLKPQSARR